MNYTTEDYLESLQNDLNTIISDLNLDEGTNFSNIAEMTQNGEITKGGGGSGFTGHYDATGLAQIGWTSDDIQYYQDNAVLWNADQDDDYKLTSKELSGTAGSYARFVPKTTSATSFYGYLCIVGIPSLSINKTDWSNTFRSCYNLITIPLLNTSNATNMNNMFRECRNLKSVPLINMGNVTTANNMFNSCDSLRIIPLLDTSKLQGANAMFGSCHSLTTFPQLNMSSVIDMTGMFSGCYLLSDESLNNILKMCIGASLYTGTKSLSTIGIDYSTYSSRIQELSSYQDFVSAGWSI